MNLAPTEKVAAAVPYDDLAREVFCVLGMPIDVVDMPTVVRKIELAAEAGVRFLLSTPNTNFLVNFGRDAEFRESLLDSDLSPPDGMPVVWIARLLGIPVKARVAGSDIFEALKARTCRGRPLKIFLFGATEEIAAAASKELNRTPGMRCVGWICPGFGDVTQLSEPRFIETINASEANFLVAALGAQKGQQWLYRNRDRLAVPVRSHLGAVINFQAGVVKRSPACLRIAGLEWLWRIKEEPSLWKRYRRDGTILLGTLLTRIVPLALYAYTLRRRAWRHDFVIVRAQNSRNVTLRLIGYATAAHVPSAAASFREALAARKQIIVDFSGTLGIDARFLGLVLMLRKMLKRRGELPLCIGVSLRVRRQFWLHGLNSILQM